MWILGVGYTGIYYGILCIFPMFLSKKIKDKFKTLEYTGDTWTNS